MRPDDKKAVETSGKKRHTSQLTTELPPNWNNPILDRYDGSTMLDEHIDAYVSQLTLYSTDGHIYC